MNKTDILNMYKEKKDKLFASNILDKITKFEKTNTSVTTNFLDLNEFRIAIALLNKFKVKYEVFSLEDILEKRCIAILPEYTDGYDFPNVKCIKVTANKEAKLSHKDYMGSIYNIGIMEDMIGDIIALENYAYIFLMDKVLEYVLLNYTNVGKHKVEINVINFCDLKEITYNFEDRNVIVPSERIDSVLAHLYNLSRSQVESKVQKNEVYVNSKCVNSKTYILKENDIVSFRKFGKFKYIGIVKKTKNSNLVVSVKIYK